MAAKFATDPLATKQSDNPLWRFSLEVYGKPNVADELLRLQDECEADVLWLLTALWLASQSLKLSPEQLQQPVYERWRAQMIRPIRQLRRACDKTLTPALYEHLKKAELEAEREGTWLLCKAFADRLSGAANPDMALNPDRTLNQEKVNDIAQANLSVCLGKHGHGNELLRCLT
ncbi:MAG: TIGR02444 family protein [Oleibacter sp.]|nr:TIGR02444 family protein [Thalassolituus sp.]